jgi:hypothetical protein
VVIRGGSGNLLAADGLDLIACSVFGAMCFCYFLALLCMHGYG